MLWKRSESKKGTPKRKQKTRQKWVKECSKIDFGNIFDTLKMAWATIPVTSRACVRDGPWGTPRGFLGEFGARARINFRDASIETKNVEIGASLGL